MIVKNYDDYQNISTFTVESKHDSKMQKSAPEIDEKVLGGNPYMYTLVIPVTKVVKVDIDDMEGVVVDKVFYAERTPKVSLYKHETSRSNVAKLSDKAKSLYLHILYTLKANKDYIYLNREFYMRENEISSLSTFYGAVKELIRYEFIQKTNTNEVYWINPHRFFAGNRINKYKDRMKIEGTLDKTKSKPTGDKKEPFSFSKGEKEDVESEYAAV